MSPPDTPEDIGPWIRRVRGAWRELTGGANRPDSARATLVAVSGGADSAALAVALGTLADARIVLGLILHDLRPAELVEDDRRAVEALAQSLGLRLLVEHAAAREGNAEHGARRARYAALERLAAQSGCRHIATAHHGWDQAETVLMALCRGGSADALVGIRERRASGTAGVDVIRPMLACDPRDAHRVCRALGYAPRTDATNADPARARARFRARVVPHLALEHPDLGAQLRSSASQLEDRLAGLPTQQSADIGLEFLDT